MNDLLQGRKTYEPLNGFGTRKLETHFALSPVKTKATEANSPACAEKKPEIELIEADGRIQQIVVQCGCGERITLNCAY